MHCVSIAGLRVAGALSVCLSTLAWGQSSDTEQEIKRQIEELKEQQKKSQREFEEKIRLLEGKLAGKADASSSQIKTEGLLSFRFDGESKDPNSFFVRRSELKFFGSLGKKMSWAVMVDVAKELKFLGPEQTDQSSRILQDAFVSYRWNSNWIFTLGQRKVPFSFEGTQSSADLLLLERALFLSAGKLGDVRDVGLYAQGKLGEFQVIGAFLNGLGESQNRRDVTSSKSVATRVVAGPFREIDVQAGISAMTGADHERNEKSRWGADLQWADGAWVIRSEYAAGVTKQKRQAGWYVVTAYRLAPDWEVVLRYDLWNPNLAVLGSWQKDFTFGANYDLLGEKTKLQFNYVISEMGKGPTRHFIRMGLQSKF